MKQFILKCPLMKECDNRISKVYYIDEQVSN